MATGSSQRSALLVLLLVIFILAILLFIGVLFNYLQHPSASPTITQVRLLATLTPVPSLTPTNTSTITLTPRPTWTLRPSATVTQTSTPSRTPTPTLIRTITPAKPARYNDRYELKPWDLTQQERTIELLKANTILTPSNATFSVLAYAEGEALLRFPDSLDAVNWRWDRAYNLIRIRDQQAIRLYTDLIKSAISSRQVRSADLPTWFNLYETRLALQISSLTPQPGELGRELIEITGAGSAYLWMVETPTGAEIYPLLNDIDFTQPHENAYLYADLTNDGSPDLVIYRVTTPGVTQFIPPHIFELSSTLPVELPLQEEVPIDFGLEPRTKVEVSTSSTSTTSLRLTNILMPSCPTHVTEEFSWNGEYFSTSQLQYELVLQEGFLAYCQLVIDEATANWGPDATISIITPLLDLWPPEQDIKGQPYPVDAPDQLRYRLAVEYALADNQSRALSLLSEIIDTPTVPDSAWVTPAEEFLRTYQKPEHLYITCQQAQNCNLRDAMHTMVKYSATDDPSIALGYLERQGVKVVSSGRLDFDQDGQDERWMIIQPRPEEKLEFWILSNRENDVQAVFVEVWDAGQSYPYFHEPAGTIPVVQFELHQGFVFRRLKETRQAYIEWVEVDYARPTVILDGYNQAVSALMVGQEPVKVLSTLLELFHSPRFTGDCIAYRICDQFHYTLALVYNLVGEDTNAIDEYLWVWRNYGQSQYAILARLKLNYFPLPTFTATPGPSRTPTRTATPPSGTVNPTKTSTITPESYP